jgi:penicillin-binding protein 1A
VARWSLLLVALGLGAAAFGGFQLWHMYRHDIPQVLSADAYRPALKSRVFAENGELIAEFGVDDRIITPLDQIPPLVIKAFIAAEDKHFYSHFGIDLRGILSSVIQVALVQRNTLRGASTLTQQLAKGLLVKKEGYAQGTARTFSRKIKEALLALKLERHLSKEEILYMYLNEVYLGHGSYGVAAAAHNYFRKELKDLSLGQIAILAGLPQAPSRFSPQNNFKAALTRQSYVLSRMQEDGFISAQEYKQALTDNKKLEVFPREDSFLTKAPYFSEHIRRQLLQIFDQETVYEKGLNIYTTLDLDRETNMQKALRSGLLEIDKRQGFLGPVFRPSDAQEKNRAYKAMIEINQKNLLNLDINLSLAQVKNIDLNLQAIFVTTNQETGVIPLAGMYWARKREPTRHYEYSRLRSVEGVLRPGDIILVKKQRQESIIKMAKEAGLSASFEGLRSHNTYSLYSLEQEPAIEGAMLALEPGSGYVNAMNGGYSFERSEFNRAYQACRQPGSVFKPVVYSAALALKKYTPATMVLDAPLTFRDGSESSWKPKNIGQRYKGEVTVHDAVMNSMNVPTINVMADVGTKAVIDWAAKLGISSKLKAELGTGIGSSCITPWELAKVFMVMANLGEVIEPVFIKEVTDRDQKRLSFNAHYSDPWISRGDRLAQAVNNFMSPPRRVMTAEDSYTMHYLLTEAAGAGTGQRTRALGRVIAGKTGTTNDSYDTWFAGYAKNLLSVVWIGSDSMDMPLGVYEQGGRTAVPLFNAFMAPSLRALPKESWDMPKSMCLAHIDAQSGLRLESEQPQSFLAPFRCGEEPRFKSQVANANSEQAMQLMGAY